MELWYLFVLIALVLASFLVGTQIVFMVRSRQARKSREKLRDRAVDQALASRLFVGGRIVSSADPQPLPAQSVDEEVEDRIAEQRDTADKAAGGEVSFSDYSQDEIMALRSRLQEQDETVIQLQQVLDELTTTTATRESVDFLQKQLQTARNTVLQQEAELKQLRREMEQRRPIASTVAVQAADEQASQFLIDQLEQSNQSRQQMQEQLAQQSSRTEMDAEQLQQNAIELRRLRSELESVSADRANARARIAQLQDRVVQQQTALDELVSQHAVSEALKQASQMNEDEHVFLRPAYVQVEEDDLKRIKGIGPVLEQRLQALGITTFRQLAECSEQDIEAIATAIGAFPGHIKRDDWIGKARELAQWSKDLA